MGALIACVILMGRTLAPLAQLAKTLTRINQARSSYRSLNAVMQAGREHPDDRQWISRPALTGEIEFEDVRFSILVNWLKPCVGYRSRSNPVKRLPFWAASDRAKAPLAGCFWGFIHRHPAQFVWTASTFARLTPVTCAAISDQCFRTCGYFQAHCATTSRLAAYAPVMPIFWPHRKQPAWKNSCSVTQPAMTCPWEKKAKGFRVDKNKPLRWRARWLASHLY